MYASSEGLSTVCLEAEAIGGQAGTSSMIRNYLGFPRGISGMRLAQRARGQALRFGTRFFTGWPATGISPCADGGHHIVHTEGGDVHTRTVLVATGVDYRRLGVEPIEELVGRGVYYGAAMAAARELAGDHVVIVGGGNSAGQAAIHAARFASAVTIVVRRPDLAATMSSYLIDEIEWNPRITVRGSTRVVDGGPDDVNHLAWLHLEDVTTGEQERVEARGLFLLLGAAPECGWLPDEVLRDEHGFVVTGRDIPRERWVGRRAARGPGDHAAGRLLRRRHPVGVDEAGRLGDRRGRVGRVVGAHLAGRLTRRPAAQSWSSRNTTARAGSVPWTSAARTIRRSCATSTSAAASIEPVPASASAVPTASCEPIRARPTIVVIARNRL